MTYQNTMKFASDITRVPFGRTDVSTGANDAPPPELSYGHGLEGASFHGVFESWDFLIFAANWERIVEPTRVRFGRTEVSVRLDCIYAVSYTHLTLPTNREV